MQDFYIYAVDFDGTICEDKFPRIGEPNKELIEFLKLQQKIGNKIILWTCRSGELLEKAVRWCERSQGLIFDAVNENLPGLVASYCNDSRKVYADYYIDDHTYANIEEICKLPYKREGQ